MAKELPYFKFYCSEWNDGDITLEEFKTQGVFINICSLYWSRGCNLSLDKLKRRFRDNIRDIEILISENLIKNLDDGSIKIRFLDEQWSGKDARSTTSRINGAKGGRPKKPKKPNDNLTEPDIEKRREEENREDIESRKQAFRNTVRDKWIELGHHDYLSEKEIFNFYEYWTEHGDKDKKLRFEKEKSFGIGRRLGTWKKNNFNKPKDLTGTPQQGKLYL